MPRLGDTARRYLDDTVRARLASPGLERYRVERKGGAGAVAVLALVALIGAFVWLSTTP
ncbi:hypothetical protein [Anaeromyxobacter sp. SG26]|uniref:hypothetical protein n=1 Tax=Anaeromyxobacter sp. SG26 TaxID=2925407 RepID=UPI001F566BF6|nr:hypothetical protein [Anaeromyxobacter sp. SG26]